MTYTRDQNILILNILKWSKNSVSGWPAWPGPSLSVISALFLIEVFASPQILASLAPSHVKPGLTDHRQDPGNRGKYSSLLPLRFYMLLNFQRDFFHWKCLHKIVVNQCVNILRIYPHVISLALSPPSVILWPTPEPLMSRHHLTPHSSVLEIRILITSSQPHPGSHDFSCRNMMRLCYV